MAVVTGSWLADILLLLSSVLGVLYYFLTSTATYFKDRGIPFLKPTFFLGYKDIFTMSQSDVARVLYNQFPGERFYGYFQTRTPIILLKDSDLIQSIMVKDFTHFEDHAHMKFFERDLLMKNLFYLRGQSWRYLRHRLNHGFSYGRLKQMFSQIDNSGGRLLMDLEKTCLSEEPIEAKELSVNFTTEVVASTAFGLDLSKENPQTDEILTKITNYLTPGFRQMVLYLLFTTVPKLLELLKMSFFSTESDQYFVNLVRATKEYRRRNKIERNDFFQLLMNLQEEYEGDDVTKQLKDTSKSSPSPIDPKLLTDEAVTAHAFGLLTGAASTVSGTLSFALYHIARDENVQERIVKELRTVIAEHGWSYQAIRELTFLDQVLQETLRMYPPLPLIYRECTAPYLIPDTDIVLEKGAVVAIPIAGLHYSSKFYPNPLVFSPERFTNNNYKSSSKYMPFGDGPRICIAMPFAVIEMKVFVAKILSHYSIDVNSKTREPFTFDLSSFGPKPLGGIWVNFKKRENSF